VGRSVLRVREARDGDLPALVELRLVQELGRTTGHTVVIGQPVRA